MRNKINLISLIITAVAIGFIIYKGQNMNVGIDIKNMDLSVSPKDNFYDYATAGWRKNNPLKPEFSVFGSFHKLDEEVLKQTEDLIKEISNKNNSDGSLEKKIATVYNEALDYDKRNTQGLSPLEKDLKEIDDIKNIAEYLGRAHRWGDQFWSSGPTVDSKDSDSYIMAISQGGIGISKDYFLDNDEKSIEIRKKYKEYIGDSFRMFGIDEKLALGVYDLELEMAKSFYTKEKLRDPILNYHKMSFSELKKKFSGFDWDIYFKERGIVPDFIDVGQIEPIEKSLQILKTKDQKVLAAYLKWQIINGSLSVLGDKQYDLYFNFYGKTMSGKLERRPKWKEAVDLTEGVLGEAIGKLYVKKYFPESSKKRMIELVENLRIAYKDRIENLSWMSGDTKKKALKKLESMRVKIGYPDKFMDYTKLEIIGDSLYKDLERANTFMDNFWIEKLKGKKVDKSIWYMNPQTVNAYYSPSENEICFPAGILQPPFFDANADDAFNYGAIGSVIGHEMTHGFDDSGRHFDENGNMNNWWTTDDEKEFIKLSNVLKEFFNKIEVAKGLHANGEFTVGENLADYGGVTISYDAYKKFGKRAQSKEFSPEQRFFLAYAGTEASNIRDDEIIKRTKTDEHSLSKWRVNAILPQIDSWYDAFDIKQGDKMFVPESNRVRLW